MNPNLNKQGVWKVDNDGKSNPNLVSGTSNEWQSASIAQYYTTLHTSDTFWGLQENDTVVYRVYLKAPLEKKVRTRIQFYNSSSDRPSIHGNFIEAGQEGYSSISWTMTATQRAYARMELLVDCNDGTTNTDTFYWKNVKLERATKPTPWIPNSSDALYTSFNFTNASTNSGFIKNDNTSQIYENRIDAHEFYEI